jgi:phage repressor protein C with HTH and peptisase S24 domain
LVRVRSDNPAPMYAAYEFAEAAIDIIGRAVWTPTEL